MVTGRRAQGRRSGGHWILSPCGCFAFIFATQRTALTLASSPLPRPAGWQSLEPGLPRAILIDPRLGLFSFFPFAN
jgi:hypothetical protein